MKNFQSLLVISAVLLSCNAGNNKTSASADQSEVLSSNTCYSYEANGSIIALRITDAGETVTGNLVYAWAEKDRNVGEFTGKIEGDVLIGIYTFQSEGVESKREVAFLIKENTLVEGFGEIEDDGNGIRFADADALDFDGSITLSATDCGNLAALPI